MKPTDNPIVRLRAMEPEDLDVLYKIENDVNLWNVGVTNVPYSRFTLHNYIADCLNDIYADRQLRLMVEDKDGDVVGIVDLVDFDPRHLRAEIGVVIKNEYRKQGYATAAIQKLKDYSHSVLHLHQLYALVDDTNDVSKAMLSVCGFTSSAKLQGWLYKDGCYYDAAVMQCFLDDTVNKH